MKVYKYHLNLGETDLPMPATAYVLCVGMQAGKPTLWALVDPKAKPEKATFVVVGTGHEVPPYTDYVGTCFQRTPTTDFPDGFVWHVFEKLKFEKLE